MPRSACRPPPDSSCSPPQRRGRESCTSSFPSRHSAGSSPPASCPTPRRVARWGRPHLSPPEPACSPSSRGCYMADPITGTLPGSGTTRVNFDERPILVFWETTRACLLACRHCRAEAIPTPQPGELTTEEGEQMIRDLPSFGPRPPVLI